MKKSGLMIVAGILTTFLLYGEGSFTEKQPSVAEEELIQKLEEAMFSDDHGAVEEILKKGSISKVTIDESNFLHKAAFCGQLEVAGLLIKYGANLDEADCHGTTPLHLAVYKGHEETAELLLEKKADPNIQDACGLTPMHLAAYRLNPEIVKLLLKHGANGDKPNIIGCKPVSFAKSVFDDISKAYGEVEELLSISSNTSKEDFPESKD